MINFKRYISKVFGDEVRGSNYKANIRLVRPKENRAEQARKHGRAAVGDNTVYFLWAKQEPGNEDTARYLSSVRNYALRLFQRSRIQNA